jgi:sulfate permease, SulP family
MGAWWIPPTLRGYRAQWLTGDILAGLALLAVAVPGQMATALLAGMPVVTGLYAFVAGSLLYAVLGRNRALSVGADSTIAPVLATGVVAIAAVGTPGYATAMAFTALLVGAVLIVVGLSQLGWIAEFLSTPVITGVLAGIAVEIIARQIPVILGVPGRVSSTIDAVRLVASRFGDANVWSVAIALGVLAAIVAAHRINPRLPGVLVALVLSAVVVKAFDLSTHHGVTVIGAVHGGLPHIGFPTLTWSQLRHLPATVLTVSFLCIAQTAATIRSTGGSPTPETDFNRDLIGVGAGSIAAGLIGTMPVDASPPNTAIVNASGSHSQLANVMAALAVLVVIVALTGLLSDVPKAMLGATLVFIATKLFRVGELRTILHFDRLEFALGVATLLVVAFVGVEQGVLLAMFLSLAARTRRSARPSDAILGREPGTDHWIPADIGRPTEQVPGVLVYLVYAPLWYGNADYLRLRILGLVEAAQDPVRVVIIDADGMSDIDYTGLASFRAMKTELGALGVDVAIARASHLVHHDLKRGALLDQLGRDHLFASVEEAVRAFSA